MGCSCLHPQWKKYIVGCCFKRHATIGFFKGVLLKDEHKILQQQGNLQSDRMIPFTNVNDIEALKDVLTSYIKEAIAIEESGKKVVFKQNPEPIPEELLQVFEEDLVYKDAFFALTTGRQRGYIIYFSQPKQSPTRLGRIAKYRQQILDGVGLNDKYGS